MPYLSNTSSKKHLIFGLVVLLCMTSQAVGAQTIYWLESLTNTIKKVAYAGAPVAATTATTIASGIVPVYSFVNKSTNEIYWTDNGSGKIKKVSVSGGTITDVVTGITGAGVTAQGLFVDYTRNMLYWSETGAGLTDRVRVIDFSGTLPKLAANASDVVTGIDIVRGITVDTAGSSFKRVYYADAGTRARGKGIYRAQYAGTVITNAAATQIAVTPATTTPRVRTPQPQQLFLDRNSQFIYWADYAADTANIRRANVSTVTTFPTAVEAIYSSASVRGIYINALENSIYWTEPKNLAIKKANLATIPVLVPVNVVTGLTGFPRNLVYISADLVVPVTFISANAYPAGKAVMTEWTVNAEVNMQHYVVEKSENGAVFTDIGTVAASAVSGSEKTYRLADARPVGGDNYYRIRAVSLDGRIQRTPIMKVTFGSEGTPEIGVYPNPVQHGGTVDVQLQNLPAGNYLITVYNKAGQVVATERFAHAGSAGYRSVSVGNAATGQYTVRVQSATQSFTKEIFIN